MHGTVGAAEPVGRDAGSARSALGEVAVDHREDRS